MTPPIQHCKSCNAPVLWCITERGKRIPLNAEPDPVKGNMVIEEGGAGLFRARVVLGLMDVGQTRYTSHFVNCPEAKKWRR